MTLTSHRVIQYIGILLILALFAGAYWYFKVQAGLVINKSQNSALTSGIVGLWTLDGADISGTTATDRSGNGYNGTLTGGPVVTAGKLGQGLDFDGSNDYVSVADNAAHDPGDTADLTLAGWFYRDTFTTDDTIVAKRNGIAATDVGYTVYIHNNTDQLIFEVSDGTDEYSVTSLATFTSIGWNHFAVVWDQDSASGTEIYINGVAGNATDSGTIGNIGDLGNAVVLAIGAESDAGNPFDGKLDEIREYSRALSATEIESLYVLGGGAKINTSISTPQGTGRLESGLTGYWTLDENTGTAAADSSTNSIASGTLTGGPTWTTGQIGYGVEFDGTDDYITVADTATLDFGDADDFTISGWFNRDTFTNDHAIVAKKNGIGGVFVGYMVYVTGASGRVSLVISDGTDQYLITSLATITSTGWNHFVVVWDQDSANGTQIYVNGLPGLASTSGTIGNVGDTSNTLAFRIGSESDDSIPFDGKIDEVRVYDRVLSGEEARQLYNLRTTTGVDTGLKGYWSFNGSEQLPLTVTADRSGARNHGLRANSPTLTLGKLGQALDFDGTNDYVERADHSSLDIGDTDDLTLTGWFNRDTSNTVDVLIAKSNGTAASDTGYIVYLDASTDKLIFEVSDGTDEYSLTSTTAFTATGWNHFAVVWDQDSASASEIYINGVADSATDTGTIGDIGDLSNALSFRIGSESDNQGLMDGKLDEIRMYKRVLSAGEIESLYMFGSGAKMNTSVSTPQGRGRLDSGLRSYFALDENTGTAAANSSVNAITSGTLTGGPTWTTGQIGSAVDFDGTDDYITMADNDALDLPLRHNFSITGWFNRDTFTTDDTIVAKRDGIAASDTGYIVYIDDSTDQLIFEMSDGTDEFSLTSAATFVATGWNHFAIVQGDSSAQAWQIYINGVPNSTTSAGNIFNIENLTNALAYRIGAESDAGNPFDGKIDEVRGYGKVLSSEEVRQLYNLRTTTGVDTGLKGYWSFNGADISGTTTAFDLSGGGYNGTLTNSPTLATGKIGQGVDFDGSNDYVSVADNSVLDPGDTADLTLTGWFYRDSSSTDDTIVAKRNGIASTDTGYIAYLDDADDKLYFEVSDGTDEYQLASTSTFTGIGWNHFAIVWDQDSASASEIYVNGAADSATDTGTIGNIGDLGNAVVLAIGAESDAGNPFDGKLDEIREYNRVLSASEIAALYNQTR